MSRLLTATVVVVLAAGSSPPVLAEDGLEPPDHTIASSVIEAGTEPLVDLVYGWTEGQNESTTLELWVARTAELGEWVMEEFRPIPYQLDVELVVEQVAADGSALLEARIVAVRLLEPAADAESEAVLAALESAVGVRVREEHDAKGYLLASRLIDPFEDADEMHPARSMAVSTLKGLPVRLPLAPIGVGGSWWEVLTTTDPDTPNGTETTTKRLAGIAEDGALWIDAQTVLDIPPQEMSGGDFGLDEPVVASGSGTAALYGLVDRSLALPVWTGSSDASLEIDVPLGDGVVIGQELSAAIRGLPPDWGDPLWPTLAPIPAGLLPQAAEPDRPSDAGPAPVIDVTIRDPGAEPRQQLRYRLDDGQVEHTVTNVRMGLRTTVDGEWTEWLGMPPMEIAATTTVTGVRDDGSYDVEIVYTDVGVPMDPGQLPADAMEELEAQLSSLVGMRQTIHMDDRGRILQANTELPPGASTEDVQSAQLDAMTQELINPLPHDPVGEGAVWEIMREAVDSMGFPAVGTNTFTLSQVLPDGRLELEGETHLTADPGPMTIPDMEFLDATIDRFSTDGEVSTTVDLGLLNPDGRSTGISDYAFTIELGDMQETTEMQMSMEFQTWLVDATGE